MEVKLTDFLTLKLEESEVFIYIAGEVFTQCKFLLLQIPKKKRMIKTIDSIDEAEEIYSRDLEKNKNQYQLSPEEEFWGHCSNLQAWVENEYDTRILHRNLAFPLLRKLAKAGDKKAEYKFKEEVLERSRIALEKRTDSILLFFIEEGYYNIIFEDPKEIELLQAVFSYFFNEIKDKKYSRLFLVKAKIKNQLAQHPNTTPLILNELSKDRNEYVREKVASNPNTFPSTLLEMSNDESIFVRLCLVKNPKTPLLVIERLSKDKDPHIRKIITVNTYIEFYSFYHKKEIK